MGFGLDRNDIAGSSFQKCVKSSRLFQHGAMNAQRQVLQRFHNLDGKFSRYYCTNTDVRSVTLYEIVQIVTFRN